MLLPDLGAAAAVALARARWPSAPVILIAPAPKVPSGEHSPRAILHDAVTTALLAGRASALDLLGTAPVMKEVADALPKLTAVNTTTILLRGERGVGKGLVAHHLHRSGRRHDQPFVRICCETAPAELMQRLIFGQHKADGTVREGLLEAASEGILYMDDAHLLGPSTQARLLRAAERGTFKHLGGTQEIALKTSIIGATFRLRRRRAPHDLSDLDLHAVVELRIPPLRNHTQDIPQLVQRLIAALPPVHATQHPTLSPAALEALCAYAWPGNLGELRQILARVAAHPTGPVIDLCDLPPLVRFHSTRPTQAAVPEAQRAQTRASSPVPAADTPPAQNPPEPRRLLHFPATSSDDPS